MSETRADIFALLAAQPNQETGKRILQWFDDLEMAVLRGDAMLGLLDSDELEKVPEALRHAAACGCPEAWELLARWLEEQEGIGALDDADQALVRAVEADLPGADLKLARLRWFSRRDTVTDAQQREAYSIARNALDRDPDDAEAMHLLGQMTCHGFGVSADPGAAYVLQQQAAKLGNSDAEFELYVHLSTGLGVEKDERAAFEHNRHAAENEHPRAAYNLGAFYARGLHVDQDLAEAAKWYRIACDAGSGRACATLAAMHATGEGVEQDLSEAENLFYMAEDSGFDPSPIKDAIGWQDPEDDFDLGDEEDSDEEDGEDDLDDEGDLADDDEEDDDPEDDDEFSDEETPTDR